MEFSLVVLKPGYKKEHINILKKELRQENLKIYSKFHKTFSEKEIETFFSTSLNLAAYKKYMTSAPCMIFLIGGRLCSYKLRHIKKRIRKRYNVDSTMINNIIHSSDDGIEFYLQSMACEEELKLNKIVLNGFADMCVFEAKRGKIKSDINALIFRDMQMCDRKYLNEYDYIGFESYVNYNEKKIKIINYYYDTNRYISAVYFENNLYDDIDCLKYLDINMEVKGIVLYNEQVSLMIVEEVEDYLEQNLPNWFIIGGDGVTIGEYNYNRFLEAIKVKNEN